MTCQETAKDPNLISHRALHGAGSLTGALSYIPSRQNPLNFNIHLGYAELRSNPKAKSRWQQLDAMGLGPFP